MSMDIPLWIHLIFEGNERDWLELPRFIGVKRVSGQMKSLRRERGRMLSRPRSQVQAHPPKSLERGRWQENLRFGHRFELSQSAADIHLPETESDRKRYVARNPPHGNFKAFAFELSYRHK